MDRLCPLGRRSERISNTCSRKNSADTSSSSIRIPLFTLPFPGWFFCVLSQRCTSLWNIPHTTLKVKIIVSVAILGEIERRRELNWMFYNMIILVKTWAKVKVKIKIGIKTRLDFMRFHSRFAKRRKFICVKWWGNYMYVCKYTVVFAIENASSFCFHDKMQKGVKYVS